MRNMFIKTGITVLAVILFFALVLAESETRGRSVLVNGADLYRISCQSCHGPQGEAQPPDVPSLQDFSKKLNLLDTQDVLEAERLLRERLRAGGSGMPAFGHFTEAEETAILNYLRQLTGVNAVSGNAIEVSTERLGEQIVKANCTSCHSAESKDRRMRPATLAGTTQRFTKTEISNLLDNGVCMMPAFNHFTSVEKEALYSYLETLEGEPQGQSTMGEMCPMVRAAMSADKTNTMKCCMQRR
ncbi:MAG: c-type cytochrome [Candidatus Zixiibacteriota bacterium]